MEKEFVTYEIALLLKELGYIGDDCFGVYIKSIISNEGVLVNFATDDLNGIDLVGEVNAPLWQQVINWLREKHNYNITYNVLEGYDCKKIINYIFKGGDIQSHFKILSKKSDYYEARESAILKVIDLIKK